MGSGVNVVTACTVVAAVFVGIVVVAAIEFDGLDANIELFAFCTLTTLVNVCGGCGGVCFMYVTFVMRGVGVEVTGNVDFTVDVFTEDDLATVIGVTAGDFMVPLIEATGVDFVDVELVDVGV